MSDDFCHCMPGRTGHVHAAKISPEDWAMGILAMEKLTDSCMMVHLAGLSKAAKQARRILKAK